MKQRRPFQITITKVDKTALKSLAKSHGTHYGIMFDTGGKFHVERINPTAQYAYVWRTDEDLIK